MKKRLVAILLMVFVLVITGCGNSNRSGEEPIETDGQMTENIEQTDKEENISTESVADYPAAIMVNDTIYLLEGVPMSTEVDESAIIGYTESYTNTFPENNGETNFNRELGMPYAQVEGGIAVLYNNEWYLGTPDSKADENTITFTGTIIENTIDSLVPVICVKPMEEEVIPYKAVFFELPENEAGWALRIGSVVTITCDNTFTEQAPYFGTLIFIIGDTTETDNSSESDQSLNDYSVVIGDLTIALYESKQDITARLDEIDLSYNEYDSYYMIDEALCAYFEDDICVRLSFLNEVPQTAKDIHKNDSYSRLIEQYGESFEKHTYTGKELYDIYRYSSNDYICEFGILPEISDSIYNIEIYTPNQYPIYEYGEELEQNNY